MSKIKKLLQGAGLLLRQPSLINLIINQNDNWKDKTPAKYQNGFPQISLQQLFPNFDGKLDKVAFLDGGSMVTDLLLLKNACLQFEQCKYFEIGTWRGESVINLVHSAQDLNTLDLAPADYKKFNLPDGYEQAHAYFIKNEPRVKQHFGDSKRFGFAALNQKYDVVFIDGNHHYDYVVADTKNVFQHLLHENSIVIWHDYGFSPEKIRYEILNAILEATPTDKQQFIYQVENTMCAIYIPQKLDTKTLKMYENPRQTYSIEIKVNK